MFNNYHPKIVRFGSTKEVLNVSHEIDPHIFSIVHHPGPRTLAHPLARYRANCETLVAGMAALGFRTFLRPEVQAPIIVTFHAPAVRRYDFRTFYARVRERGYILYPGKLTQVETFRVGCIGAIDANEMRNVVSAVGATLRDMGIAA